MTDRIRQKWLQTDTSEAFVSPITAEELGYSNLIFPFLLVAIGAAVAVAVSAIEKIKSRIRLKVYHGPKQLQRILL